MFFKSLKTHLLIRAWLELNTLKKLLVCNTSTYLSSDNGSKHPSCSGGDEDGKLKAYLENSGFQSQNCSKRKIYEDCSDKTLINAEIKKTEQV